MPTRYPAGVPIKIDGVTVTPRWDWSERYYTSFVHTMRGGYFVSATAHWQDDLLQIEVLVPPRRSPLNVKRQLYSELGWPKPRSLW